MTPTATAHGDSDSDSYATHSHSHSNSHRTATATATATAGAEVYSDTEASSDTAAPTVRLVDRRSVIVSCLGTRERTSRVPCFIPVLFATTHLLRVAGRNFRSTRSETSSRPAAEP